MLECMIVEDETHHQQLLEYYVKKIGGVKVMGVFSDTAQASRDIERYKPDFIFLDINILGLQGPEFIELLVYQPKVIIVSAHSEEFMKSHYKINYTAYIQKPIDELKLSQALKLL